MKADFLKKRTSYIVYADLRQRIIREFKLHIQDEMTYDQFKSIYDKYGDDIKDSDFARVIFDVDYIQFQKVKRGDHRTMRILSFEYYTENDFWRIINNIIQREDEIFSYGLNYEKILILYSRYGEKFSLEMFSEHVLGIHGKILANKKSKPNERTEAIEINLEQIESIQTIREKIGMEPEVFIGNEINYVTLHKLYIKFCPNQIIDERTFAICILAIKDDVYSRMSNKPLKKVKILLNYPINPDYLASLRAKLIEEEQFYFLQPLNVDKIDDIYMKNGGIYSKSIFLQEVFDINSLLYSIASRRKHNITILSDSDIQQYIKELQERIIKEEKLEINQLIKVARIRRIFEKYGNGFDEKYFCVEILRMSINDYYQMNDEGEFRVFVYANIKTRNLNRHTLNGIQLDEKKAEERRKNTERKIRQHDTKEKSAIKQKKIGEKKKTKKTKEIEVDRIKAIRKLIIEKYSFHKGDSISVGQFEKIYGEFGKDFDKKEFALHCLDISNDVFNKKVKNADKKYLNVKNIEILKKEFMNEEQIENLKKEVMHIVRIDDNDSITLLEFNRVYGSTKHTLSRYQFANIVFGMSYSKYYTLNSGKIKKSKIQKRESTRTVKDDFKADVTYNQKIRFALRNSLHRRQEIDIKKFGILYGKYIEFIKESSNNALSERDFATQYLDIDEQRWYRMKNGKKVKILCYTIMTKEDIDVCKQEVITKFLLYPNKQLYYSELKDLIDSTWNMHIMNDFEFAINVLDMSRAQYSSAKSGECQKVTILSNEETINEPELEIINIMQELINKGMSLEEIANKMWMPIDTVINIIIENEIELDKADISIIFYLYKKGIDIIRLSALTHREVNELSDIVIEYEYECYIKEKVQQNETSQYLRHYGTKNKPRKRVIKPSIFREKKGLTAWQQASLDNWQKSIREEQKMHPKVDKAEIKAKKQAEILRRKQEKSIRHQEKENDIKTMVYTAALNAKNGTFITKEELLGIEGRSREYIRKKILNIGNALCTLEDYGGVDEARCLIYLCNAFNTYDIVVAFMQISKLQSRLLEWPEEDRVVFIDNINKYKVHFRQKANNGIFIDSNEHEYIKTEKNYIEKKIEFFGNIMLLSGCLTKQDILIIHELCKKYIKYKAEFEFITACINYLESSGNSQDYWNSENMDWIKRKKYQASRVYALGLIGEYIKKFKNLSQEDICNIADVTELSIKEVKTILEQANKTIEQRRIKREKKARKPGGESVGD